jgi:hypothetical protein
VLNFKSRSSISSISSINSNTSGVVCLPNALAAQQHATGLGMLAASATHGGCM